MREGAIGQDICDRTRQFALRIIKLYRVVRRDEIGQVIGRQLLRAGTSIGANVEEAQAAQSKADFRHKMSLALKEARETHYWLRLLSDAAVVPPARLTELLAEVDQLMRIIYTIIQNAKD
jgi:four helix bundle protein